MPLPMPMSNLVMGVAAGLALFFYGLNRLMRSAQALAADRARTALARFTANPLMSVLTGVGVTTVMTSSSVTIILVIAFVNAGTLSVTQACGLILGSNIGTTVSSQLFALDLGRYSPLLLVTGFALRRFRGVAVMFGAEVGTCLDTLIASLGRSRAALAAGLFHWVFNLSSALLGISLADPFVRFVQSISQGLDPARQIANAQLLLGWCRSFPSWRPSAKGWSGL